MRRKIVAFGVLSTVITSPVVALDLKALTNPIHYDCKPSLAGGVWQEDGKWKSGKIVPSSEVYRFVIERYEATKIGKFSRCEAEQRITSGMKFKGTEFCLTHGLAREEKAWDTNYCQLTWDANSKGNSTINCYLGRFFVDTDYRFVISSDSLEFSFTGHRGVGGAGIVKYDCVRLDR